jgi:uncharacterized protein
VTLTPDTSSPKQPASAELELTSWRRDVASLYASVRAEDDAERGHAIWRAGRDRLFRTHPQSPLDADDPRRDAGLPYWPYDADLRFELPLLPPGEDVTVSIPTGGDATTSLRLFGRVQLPSPIGASVGVWWLDQYAGGLFLPLRDDTAGDTSYGGGRYVLDTAKGADLGGGPATLVVDLNFSYHPSCCYSSQWQCPLAPEANVVEAPVFGGERL